MNATLLSRTLAIACFGSVLAVPQLSVAEVQLYGSLFSTVEMVESRSATSRADGGSDHTYGPSYRLSSHSSYFGLRGTEKLDDGLSAFFQIENSVNIATGSGSIGGRNTGVGLKSDSWGTIVLGNWDSPLKLSSVRADPWRTKTVSGYNNIISTPGFGIGKQRLGKGGPTGGFAAFDNRARNTVQYWTPQVSGISARFMYSFSNELELAPIGKYDPYFWGFSVTYDQQPFWVSYGYERHNDYFGINSMVNSAAGSFTSSPFAVGAYGTSSTDEAHRLSMGYTWGNTIFGLVYERLKYRNKGLDGAPANAMSHFERDAVYASVVHKFNSVHQVRLAYGQTTRTRCSLVANSCPASNLGARMFAIGYAYNFSKRTQFSAQYAQINNKKYASYTFGENTPPLSGAGATLRGISIGLAHQF